PRLLAIERRISKLSYSRRCFEASAVRAYERFGIKVVPGVSISCVVVDAKRWVVEPYWCASGYDVNYYLGLLEKALDEVMLVQIGL
ncbi:DNA polymerase I, partial [Archaeoglobales archaeon]